MESLKRLISNTQRVHPKIISNAEEVDIFDLVVNHVIRKEKYTEEPDPDEKNMKQKKFSKVMETLVFKAKAHALTDGKNVFWDIKIELFPDENKLNLYKLPDLTTPCWVQCSCPYFLYFCEYAVTKAGSSEIEFSNGRKPRVRNKNEVPILCKHLIAASKRVVPAVQKWAKTKVPKAIKFV